MFRHVLAPALAAVALSAIASSASAQVIYEPVRYQYGHGMKYYYGGTNASMHAYADEVLCRNGYPSSHSPRHTGLHDTLGQIGEQRYVYTDCLPRRNAAVYGYTAVDAYNEANANVPLYFRKRDLLNAATVAEDGTLVVSAYAKPVAEGAKRDMRVARPGEPKPRAILILPKKGLKREGDTKPVNLVASAK